MRRRSHRSHGGSRRRKSWEGSWGYQGLASTGLTVDGGSVGGFEWARVPAGVEDPAQDYLHIPQDYTLLRTLWAWTLQFQYQNAADLGSLEVGVGILAWDSITTGLPVFGDGPSPITVGGAGLDWIIRGVGTISASAPINDQIIQVAVGNADLVIESKARRKLSAATGLLWCFEIHRNHWATASDPMKNVMWTFDSRHLFLEA